MTSTAEASDIAVFTCVRDASEHGGGITSVALPVHAGMYQRDSRSRLLFGLPSQRVAADLLSVGPAGVGFSSFDLEGGRAEVVHVHGMWTPFELRACAYARRNGLPLVISPHGMLEPWALAHKRVKKWLAWHLYQRRCMERADLLVVNSQAEYQTLRRLGLSNRIAVIENGVDTVDLDPSIVRTDMSKCVLFLSRLSPVKGILDLLRAWTMLPHDHGYELRIYGRPDPGYADVLHTAIEELGLGEGVKLCGPVFGRDKWQVYKNADIFVLPSYSENFGIVVAESLLAGVPVITTNATPWQCLTREHMGWLVDNDCQQLAAVMLRAMELSDEDRAQMGQVGAAFACANFSWPEIVEKYSQTYAWLLGQRSQKPAWVYEE
jgi:glycosyltransferase involved in cell wall biosynthesis